MPNTTNRSWIGSFHGRSRSLKNKPTGIDAATMPKGSRAQEAMFRQLIERISRV